MRDGIDVDGIVMLPANGYRRERWPNGAGWTRCIASGEGASGELTWRLSIAELSRDTAYSTFPGLHRQQMLLSGNGFGLLAGDAPERTLDPPHGQAGFDGSLPARCRLFDGPVQAFNVFHRPGAVDARLWLRPVVGPMYIFPATGELWAVHMVAGRVDLAAGGSGHLLEQGDTALLTAGQERVSIEGSGDLALVRFRFSDSA